MCSIVPLAVAGLADTSVGVRRQVHFLLALQRAHRTLQRMPQNCLVRADAHPMSYSSIIGA
jgi:hypothetical protein